MKKNKVTTVTCNGLKATSHEEENTPTKIIYALTKQKFNPSKMNTDFSTLNVSLKRLRKTKQTETLIICTQQCYITSTTILKQSYMH